MTITQQYEQAFKKCYPQKSITFKVDKSKDKPHFYVVIDGDRGNFSLSIPQMLSAIAGFNR